MLTPSHQCWVLNTHSRVQTHLEYTAIKLGKQKRSVLEKRLVQHAAFIGHKPLKYIFAKPTVGCFSMSTLVLAHNAYPLRLPITFVICCVQKIASVNLKPLVGDQMETILQIIEECLIGLARPDDLACWRAHVELVELLRKPSFTESDLAELTSHDDFKSRFHQVHTGVYDVIRTRKDGVATSISKLLNLQFPNFGVLEHWPDQIRFLPMVPHVSNLQKCGSTGILTASAAATIPIKRSSKGTS